MEDIISYYRSEMDKMEYPGQALSCMHLDVGGKNCLLVLYHSSVRQRIKIDRNLSRLRCFAQNFKTFKVKRHHASWPLDIETSGCPTLQFILPLIVLVSPSILITAKILVVLCGPIWLMFCTLHLATY